MTMTRKGLKAALLALAILPPAAHAAVRKPAPGDFSRPVAFPGGVRADPALIYEKIAGFRPLTLDLYQIPAKANSPLRPAIVFVHGGLWKTGDARHLAGFANFPATLAGLAAKGYVVASVNYRLSAEAHFPAAVQDVKSAIRWLRNHAGEYAIDTTRVMVWGAQAGGQIAALVGTGCGVSALEPVADANSKKPLASDCVQGVIDWYGPSDFASWDADAGRTPEPGKPTDLGAYLGCEPADCAPGVVRAASPITYVESMSPPFLIQQGSADTLVAPAQSQKLYDALKARQLQADLILYPGVDEGFIRNGKPDAAIQAQAIADMENFIAKTFPTVPSVRSPLAAKTSPSLIGPEPRPVDKRANKDPK